MDISPWVQLVREIGFPAAVAIFVLYRLDRILVQIRDDQRDLLRLLGHGRERDRTREAD